MIAAFLPDGRLHLQHGPIDLIVEAFGARAEIERAYRQATDQFGDILRLVGDGRGNFADPTLLVTGGKPYSVVTGEFNPGGAQGLAVLDQAASAVRVFTGGGGTFQEVEQIPVGAQPGRRPGTAAVTCCRSSNIGSDTLRLSCAISWRRSPDTAWR